MNTRPHVLLFAVLIAVFACSACKSSDPPAPAAQDAHVDTAAKAVAVALEFLRQQPYADDYLAETAEAVERKDDWEVFIKHVDGQNRRPSTGLIVVHKGTGEATWIRLR